MSEPPVGTLRVPGPLIEAHGQAVPSSVREQERLGIGLLQLQALIVHGAASQHGPDVLRRHRLEILPSSLCSIRCFSHFSDAAMCTAAAAVASVASRWVSASRMRPCWV